MYLSKLLVLTCILWMSGAQGSLIREAAEPVQKKSPSPQQNDLGTDISSFKYGVLLAHNILQDCKQLKDVLDSIATPETGKNKEETISFLWERAVLNNVILADSIRSNPAKYEATVDEAKELCTALATVDQQLNDALSQLRDLQKRNLLEIEFVLMLEAKLAILRGNLDKHKSYLSDQDCISTFEKNKGYPYLLQGFFAMYREKDMDAATLLFREGAQKGSKEAQLMEALCAHPSPRKIMDGILEILPRLSAAAPGSRTGTRRKQARRVLPRYLIPFISKSPFSTGVPNLKKTLNICFRPGLPLIKNPCSNFIRNGPE